MNYAQALVVAADAALLIGAAILMVQGSVNGAAFLTFGFGWLTALILTHWKYIY